VPITQLHQTTHLIFTMKFTTTLISIAAVAIGSASALVSPQLYIAPFCHDLHSIILSLLYQSTDTQHSQNATSTITITPGCPSAAPADVMVTRSGVPVPSCAAGNETVTMMTMPSMSGSPTTTGGSTQFTGAANNNGAKGVAVLVGGVFAALLV
jgi:hypothetical protein